MSAPPPAVFSSSVISYHLSVERRFGIQYVAVHANDSDCRCLRETCALVSKRFISSSAVQFTYHGCHVSDLAL